MPWSHHVVRMHKPTDMESPWESTDPVSHPSHPSIPKLPLQMHYKLLNQNRPAEPFLNSRPTETMSNTKMTVVAKPLHLGMICYAAVGNWTTAITFCYYNSLFFVVYNHCGIISNHLFPPLEENFTSSSLLLPSYWLSIFPHSFVWLGHLACLGQWRCECGF